LSRTIVIVAGDRQDQRLCRRALRNVDCSIVEATSLAAGLVACRHPEPDLVLVGQHLPDGTGIDLLHRLGDPLAAPPVIVIAATGANGVAVAVTKAGAADCYAKDVDDSRLTLLRRAVARALKERELQAQGRDSDQQARLASNVLLNITEGVFVTDSAGRIVSVNPAYCAMSGYSSAELIGRNPGILRSDRHRPEFFDGIWNEVRQHGFWRGEIWNKRKDGDVFLVRETITAISDGSGRVRNFVAVLTDVTEARKQEDAIRHRAYHDALTDLPNRAMVMDWSKHDLALASRHRKSMAVLYIDLDGFKAVNDELGHGFGDELLKAVAARLKGCVRQSDTLARLGGDEFAAVLNDIAMPSDAAVVARKMIDHLRQPFRVDGRDLQISASIGIALYPDDGDDVAELLDVADAAMYEVKRNGKSAYAFAKVKRAMH
jgi:diguanylate cyclase (GGDEF)-like protein/PAS domain S-box-containing protein